MKLWSCKIGECDAELLPDGADAPMRAAVERAYRELTGFDAAFNFSGWGAELDESERAVVENRAPSEEHYREWLIKQAAPDLYEALTVAMPKIRWMLTAALEGDARAILLAAEELNRHVPTMNAALAKASQQADTPQAQGQQNEGAERE